MSTKPYDLEKDGIVDKDGVLNEGFQILNEGGREADPRKGDKETKTIRLGDAVPLGDAADVGKK